MISPVLFSLPKHITFKPVKVLGTMNEAAIVLVDLTAGKQFVKDSVTVIGTGLL